MTIALCVSLIVHGALTIAMAVQTARLEKRTLLSGITATRVAVAAADPDDAFGKAGGVGNAVNEFDADETMKGKEAPQYQALLSRDPVGFGKIGDEPTMNVLPPGEQGDGKPKTQSNGKPELAKMNVMDQQNSPRPRFGAPALADFRAPYQLAPAAVAAANSNTSDPSHTGRLGSNAPSADPAPMSDSESDAFAPIGSDEISPGKVEARLGRKVKTVRPRLSLAAELDLIGLQSPPMRLLLLLDEAGKVKKVEIVKSTGSESADQAVKLALYQWEFEKRPAGKTGPDIVRLEIFWR